MKPLLVFITGATNSGKTTTLARLAELGGDRVGLIEVGKILRAKYGEAHFKGQAAPKHTADEAWQILVDTMAEHKAAGKHFIVVDGQPRDYEQCDRICDFPDAKMFVNLYASIPVREQRLKARDIDPDKLELSLKRLHGDLPMLYELVSILQSRGENVCTYRTDTEFSTRDVWLDILFYFQAENGLDFET